MPTWLLIALVVAPVIGLTAYILHYAVSDARQGDWAVLILFLSVMLGFAWFIAVIALSARVGP